MKKLNVLISNDDGISAQGIHELAAALSQKANVYVSAPSNQQSGSSHALSLNKSLTLKEVDFPEAEIAMIVSGYPADCIKLGIFYLKKKGVDIDIVYSGINHGYNIGTDIIYSGTVAAATEACVCGLPGVAVSVGSHGASHFDYACRLAVDVLEYAASELPKDYILNINVPDLPADEIKGTRIASIGIREYGNWFIETPVSEKEVRYEYAGDEIFYEGLSADIDVGAAQEGYASITPVRDIICSDEIIADLRKKGFERKL